MFGEAVLRFVIGGALVSLFAIIGTVFKPPTFAGTFGSAPSVAIATLTLAFATHGGGYVATEARSMILGAAGLVAYGAACVWSVRWRSLPVWMSATFCWTAWLTVTFALYMLLRRAL